MFENNQGEEFEQVIIWANMQYYERHQAVIQKIATPWKVQRRFDYVSNSNTIVSAYPEHKSTVDFGGTARGFSIWFDAKVTKSKTNFPLNNFKDHQHDYLARVLEQGGKAFYLIYSQHFNKCWLVWFKDFAKWKQENDRKSIPFTWLDANCPLVHPSKEIALDYLAVVFP
jgi:recombination protein U